MGRVTSCIVGLVALAGCGGPDEQDRAYDFEVFTEASYEWAWTRERSESARVVYEGWSEDGFPTDTLVAELRYNPDAGIVPRTASFAEVGLVGYFNRISESQSDLFRCKRTLMAYQGELEITDFEEGLTTDRVYGVFRDVWFAEVVVDGDSMQIWPVPDPLIAWLDELTFEAEITDLSG